MRGKIDRIRSGTTRQILSKAVIYLAEGIGGLETVRSGNDNSFFAPYIMCLPSSPSPDVGEYGWMWVRGILGVGVSVLAKSRSRSTTHPFVKWFESIADNYVTYVQNSKKRKLRKFQNLRKLNITGKFRNFHCWKSEHCRRVGGCGCLNVSENWL